MATVYGEVKMLTWNALHHPVTAAVLAVQNGSVIGEGRVDEDYRFEFDIADDIRGEIELRLAMADAAPSTVEATGDDLDVVILWNPINNAFA